MYLKLNYCLKHVQEDFLIVCINYLQNLITIKYYTLKIKHETLHLVK